VLKVRIITWFCGIEFACEMQDYALQDKNKLSDVSETFVVD
jgi:hypothetical protein